MLAEHDRVSKRIFLSDTAESEPGIQQLNKQSFNQFFENTADPELLKRRLQLALNDLPVRQKEALFHIFYENLTYEETAEVMHVHIKTVYNLAWRGIERLRTDLSKDDLFEPAALNALLITFLALSELIFTQP